LAIIGLAGRDGPGRSPLRYGRAVRWSGVASPAGTDAVIAGKSLTGRTLRSVGRYRFVSWSTDLLTKLVTYQIPT